MIVTVLIEDPKGSTRRHVRDRTTGEWTTYDFPHTSDPWPAHYGFIPGTVNPVDGDELDVLLLASASLETGMSLTARAVGVLLRPDGDHKILAVAVDDEMLAQAESLEDLPPCELHLIDSWFNAWSEVGTWAGPERAAREIDRAQRLAVNLNVAE